MNRFLLTVLLPLMLLGCAGNKNHGEDQYAHTDMDLLFSGYFHSLQSINDGTGYSIGYNETKQMIDFLTMVSDIEPIIDETLNSRLVVTQSSLETWKSWYEQNKDTLEWKKVRGVLRKSKKE